jgi:hypothetical protein
MNRRPFVLIGLLLATLVAAGWAFKAWSSAYQSEQAVQEWAGKAAVLRTATIRNQAKLTEDKRAAEALQTQADALKKKAAPAPSAGPRGRAGPAQMRELASSDPKVREAYLNSYRANLPMRYAVLFQKLNLSPSQIEKFEDAQVAHEDGALDLLATAKDQGLSRDDPAIKAMAAQQATELQTAEKQILGDDGMAQLQQDDRVQPVQGAAFGVSALLALGPNALSGAQLTQLNQAIAESSSAYQAGGAATAQTIDWEKTIAQAQTFLTPAQLEAVKAQAQFTPLMGMMKSYYEQNPKK